MFVRFYRAAGGRIGLPGHIDGPDGFEQASYQAGLLILAGGAACMVLSNVAWRTASSWWPRIGGRELPRRAVYSVFVAPCVAAGVFAICHCIGGIVTNALELMDVIDIESTVRTVRLVSAVAVVLLSGAAIASVSAGKIVSV